MSQSIVAVKVFSHKNLISKSISYLQNCSSFHCSKTVKDEPSPVQCWLQQSWVLLNPHHYPHTSHYALPKQTYCTLYFCNYLALRIPAWRFWWFCWHYIWKLHIFTSIHKFAQWLFKNRIKPTYYYVCLLVKLLSVSCNQAHIWHYAIRSFSFSSELVKGLYSHTIKYYH